MRWNDIIVEASDAHCPDCDDYLGKTSEVFSPANAPASCGRCGWTDGKKPPQKPTGPQATEKTSGEYRVRINPTKTQADLFYEGPGISLVRTGDGAGSVTMREKGVWVASWKVDFYNSNPIPGTFPTMTQAVNAVKNAHKARLKVYRKNARPTK
jgi:hypothetical protein